MNTAGSESSLISLLADYNDDESDMELDLGGDSNELTTEAEADQNKPLLRDVSAFPDGGVSMESELQPENVMAEHSENLKRALENEAVVSPHKKRITKYSVDHKRLSSQLQLLLSAIRSFFTKPLNLQRMKPAITTSTFEKVHERICCKYKLVKYN